MRVLFVGLETTAVMYYRCLLPAEALGFDCIGVYGEPPGLVYATGIAERQSRIPDFSRYDVIVLQQPRGEGWKKAIRQLQDRGVKVLFEVDDYLHAIHKQPGHDFRAGFSKAELSLLEMNMRVCDGIICSTDYIAHRYRNLNHVFVCENGLDLKRYDVTVPPRAMAENGKPTVTIGWAGATGHKTAVLPWLQAIVNVLYLKPETCFATIGQGFAEGLRQSLPIIGQRAISVPFAAIEQYPGAMTLFDIALGPAARGLFYKGKSDLRWLEAGALGIPIVADPRVYGKIEHEVTGFLASDPGEVEEWLLRLVNDPELRRRVGENARSYVRERRSITVTAKRWLEVFNEVLAE